MKIPIVSDYIAYKKKAIIMDKIVSFTLYTVILGSILFLSFSMGLAVLNGTTFVLGTHVLAYWEAIIYSVLGVTSVVTVGMLR